MSRVLTPALCLAVASSALAQGTKVTLQFGSEAERQVYIARPSELDSAPPAMETKDKVAEVSIDDPKDRVVVVVETVTGSCVSRPAATVLKEKGWKLGPGDERRAKSVEVVVSAAGKPLDEGFVRLEVGGEVRERLLSVADNGTAVFRFVQTGEGAATVRYRAADGRDVVESKKLAVVDDPNGAAFTIALPKGATASPEDPANPPPRAPKESVAGRMVGIVLGLGVIGAALWGISYFLKKNREQVEKALTSAGIIPTEVEPGDPGGSPGLPEPRKKIEIVMDDPGPVGAPTAVGEAAPAVANPRLVGPDGSVYLLGGGEKSVGRDATADIALAGESSVSRSHARLVPDGDGYAVEDLGSSNGTFVNGAKVSGPTRLRRGDTVQFAGAQFTFEE